MKHLKAELKAEVRRLKCRRCDVGDDEIHVVYREGAFILADRTRSVCIDLPRTLAKLRKAPAKAGPKVFWRRVVEA